MAQPARHPPVVEIIKAADTWMSRAEGAKTAVKLISASEAFRRFNWLKGAPINNAAGDLRGMVVSAKWRAVFVTTSEKLEVVGKIAMIAGFASNLAEQSGKIESVLKSNESWEIKGLRLASIAGTASERTLAGAVTSSASVLFQSLSGYCMLAGAGGATTFGNACVQHLNKANKVVKNTFDTVTDTENQANAILWVVSKISSHF